MGSKEFSHDRRQDGSADFQTSKFQSVSIIIFSEHELIFLQSFQVIGYTSVVSLTTFESALDIDHMETTGIIHQDSHMETSGIIHSDSHMEAGIIHSDSHTERTGIIHSDSHMETGIILLGGCLVS